MTSWPAAASGTASRPEPTASSSTGPSGPRREREQQVEVARVLGEVQVVQARERLGGGLVTGGGSRHAGARRSAAGALEADRWPGLLLGRERGDQLQRDAVGGHRRHLGVVVRRRDLDDVHAGDLHGAGDPADRAQQLARQQAAGLGRAGAGRDARVDDVDVDRDVDRVGAVERLGDGVVDHRLRAALLDLAHQVPAQPCSCIHANVSTGGQ